MSIQKKMSKPVKREIFLPSRPDKWDPSERYLKRHVRRLRGKDVAKKMGRKAKP